MGTGNRAFFLISYYRASFPCLCVHLSSFTFCTLMKTRFFHGHVESWPGLYEGATSYGIKYRSLFLFDRRYPNEKEKRCLAAAGGLLKP
jgi:hypothetical protein